MIGSVESQISVTIESLKEDPDAIGGRVFLHHFVATDESGKSSDLCAPDAQGESLGFPVPDDSGGFELTCTSGAIGKCVRWGYRFWEEQPGGPPLRALHRACIRMARADYGGDGGTNTRDGTLIFFCGRFGIHPCEGEGAMAFEAAWGTEGAVCIARPRIPEIDAGGASGAYPRLASRLGPAACTLESAMQELLRAALQPIRGIVRSRTRPPGEAHTG